MMPNWSKGVRINNFSPLEMAALAQMMARGFNHSVFMQYLAANQGFRVVETQQLILLELALKYGWVTAIFDGVHPVAVALWLPPGISLPSLDYVLLLPRLGRLMGACALPRLYFDLSEIAYMHFYYQECIGNHLYLLEVVVDTAYRGQGFGAQLMHPAWNWCDTNQVPAYLECDNTDPTLAQPNQRLYQRYGFQNERFIRLWNAELQPDYFAMVRLPQQ